MANSYKYFENRECKYYPCHQGVENINCLFCYCPLYNFSDCPGNNRYIERDGRQIKVCTDCSFPHEPQNYEKILEVLKQHR